MKATIKIPKSRITAPIDFGSVITMHSACGVKLSYTEYDFIQPTGKLVMFDGYSGAHKYAPFDVEAAICFPFFCGCMTDRGERVAYAGLRLSEDKAVEWKPLIDKSELVKLSAKVSEGGTPIPSGVCCFSDEEGYKLYASHINDEVPPLAGLIVLDGQTHSIAELYGKRYAVFSTGWGDGRYTCYAGYTEEGKVTAIIADFGMIDYGKRDDSPIDVEVDVGDDMFVYDPTKTEEQNNIAHQTMIIEHSEYPAEKLKAYSRRGYAYHCMGDVDSALKDYLKAVEQSKSVTDRRVLFMAWSVYDNAAEIFCDRREYDSAIELMNEALSVNDTFYAGAYVRLIDLYQQAKRSDDALEVATRMVKARPDDPVAHMKYAECCVSAMDFRAAAAAYDLLVTEFDLYENLFDEASCFIELGDYEQALSSLNRHPAKENYEQYWYYCAYIEYKERRLYSALELAERAHEIDGEYMPALYLLIDIESLLNEYHAVARYAEEYKRLRPDNEYGYSVCAEAQLLLGNMTECARNYWHLYNKIKSDDKYAALAAITCFHTVEKRGAVQILKKLKRKKSAYYSGALFGMYITKFQHHLQLERDMYNSGTDDDFWLTLSVFLFKTDNVLHSTQIFDLLYRDSALPYEAVAQQIRAAERIGNKKHFLSFTDYYVNKFISPSVSPQERKRLAESFIADAAHKSWLNAIK